MHQSNKCAIATRCCALVATAATVLFGCSRDRHEAYVARVDGSLLTVHELASLNDSTRATHGQDLEFVEQWVTTELLYQEAVRRGLDEAEQVQRQVEATRRRLAINALLDQELYATDTAQVTEQAMLDLYNSGAADFRLKEDVALVSILLFSDRNVANEFRSNVLRGASWQESLLRIQKDSLLRPTLLQTIDRQYVTRATLYPEELWRLARALNKEEISFVVTTDLGFYVLIVHGVKHQGETPDWDYIKGELRERVLMEQRKRSYDSLLTQLRRKHTVEIRIAAEDSSAARQ